MHKIHISLLPIPEVTLNVTALAHASRAQEWEFPIATFNNGQYEYFNKVSLLNNGNVLQVITKGSDGQINVVQSEYAFDLESHSYGVELQDKHGDGSEYILRVITLATPQRSANVTNLSQMQNPQLRIAEVARIQGVNTLYSLEFIGAVDIRMAYTPRVFRKAGEPFTINSSSGYTTIQY